MKKIQVLCILLTGFLFAGTANVLSAQTDRNTPSLTPTDGATVRNADSKDVKAATIACSVCTKIQTATILTAQEKRVRAANITGLCPRGCDFKVVLGQSLTAAEASFLDAVRIAAKI